MSQVNSQIWTEKKDDLRLLKMELREVLITRRIPEPGMAMISRECKIRLWDEDRPIPREKLLEMAKGVSGIVCMLTDRIDAVAMDSAGAGLKVIATMAVGFDNIDINEATRRGIVVGNTPGVLTDATADLTWALMLSLGRRIVEGDRMMRKRGFTGWSPTLLLGADFAGKTLGIIGMGRIGTAVAKRASGFRMRVIYFDPNQLSPEKEKELNARSVSLLDLLKESDFVCLHCPLSKDTFHLIGEKELGMMKKSAYLINVSRGAVIDEKALVSALVNGKIAGAALDVYEQEPELSAGLAELDNVVLVPHIGSASIDTRNQMAVMTAQNLIAGLAGELPPFCVNPQAMSKG